MKLALAGALLAAALLQASPTPITLAESETLSDAALVARVFGLVRNSPSLAREYLPQPNNVIGVIRPLGIANAGYERGFHDLGLALRARDTGAAGLCAATTLTIAFRPTPLPKTKADDKGWLMPPFPSPASYGEGGISPSANNQRLASNDPEALPWAISRQTEYAPLAAAKQCDSLDWPSAPTITSSSAELVNLGLKLFAQAKTLPADAPTICPENRNFFSRRECLLTFEGAAPLDIVYVEKCEDRTEEPLCISLQSKRTEHGGSRSTYWQSRIIYSAGEQPAVRITHFEMNGGIV